MPGKDVDIPYVHKVVKWCRDIGYYSNAFFMLGFPDQTLADMKKTVEYAINIDIDTAAFFIAQPLPGTPMWDKVKFIPGFHPMYGKCNIVSKLWKPEQVEEIRHNGRIDFLKSRNRPDRTIRGGNFCV
jgi:hypothetical protein